MHRFHDRRYLRIPLTCVTSYNIDIAAETTPTTLLSSPQTISVPVPNTGYLYRSADALLAPMSSAPYLAGKFLAWDPNVDSAPGRNHNYP